MEELEKAQLPRAISYEDFKQNMRNQIVYAKSDRRRGRLPSEHHHPKSSKNGTTSISRRWNSRNRSGFERGLLTRSTKSSRISRRQITHRERRCRFQRPLAATMQTHEAAKQAEEATALAAARTKLMNCSADPGRSELRRYREKNSSGPSAATRRRPGRLQRGTLAKEIEDKTFAMKSGESLDVIRTKQAT